MDKNVKKGSTHSKQFQQKKTKKPVSRQLFTAVAQSPKKKQQKAQSLLVSQQLQPYYKEISRNLQSYEDHSSKKNTQQQIDEMDLADYLNMNKSSSHKKMINSFKDSLSLLNRQSKNMDNDETNIVTPGKIQNKRKDQVQLMTVDKQKEVNQLKIMLKEKDQKIKLLENQLKKSNIRTKSNIAETQFDEGNEKQQIKFLMKNNQELYEQIMSNKDEIKKLKKYLVNSLQFAKELQLQLNTLQQQKLKLREVNMQLLHEKQQIIRTSQQEIKLMKKMKSIWNSLRKNYTEKDLSQLVSNQCSQKHKNLMRNNDHVNRTNSTVKKESNHWQAKDKSTRKARQVNSAFQLF